MKTRSGIIAAALVLMACTGFAEEVKLRNGVVLQGTVRQMGNQVEVTTVHGKIVVPLAQVQPKPVAIDDQIAAIMSETPEGQVLTESEQIAGIKREAAAPRPPQPGRWHVTNKPDEFDDQPKYRAALQATGAKAKEVLVINVHKGKTDVYIVMDEYLAFDGLRVKARIDRQPTMETMWSVSTDREAAFAPEEMDLLGKILGAETLLVQMTPEYRGPITATFDVRGLREAAPELVKAWHAGKQPVATRAPFGVRR